MAQLAVANMLAGPLISVAPDLAQRVRPGGTVLLTGFRRESLPSVSAAFAPYFDTEAAPSAAGDETARTLRVALEREGWLAVEARRSDTVISSAELSESAVG